MTLTKLACAVLLLCPFAPNATVPIEMLRQQYNQHPANWPQASLQPGITPLELQPLPPRPEVTEDNKQLLALGEQLFNEAKLSRDNTLSCASCHQPQLIFSDGKRSAVGVDQQQGKRNTPAIFALELWQSFFWDGRTTTALEQALQPIENPIEMDLPLATALERLNADTQYQQRFAAVFGKSPITSGQLAQALVAFQLQLTVPETAFDRFLHASYQLDKQQSTQNVTEELNNQQLLGLHLFRTKAGCLNCHNGPLLSDNQFHVTGLHYMGRAFEDLGRYDVTGNPADVGRFRTPSLRAVTKTGPWMHNGLFTQFDGIIAFYNVGGARPKPRSDLKHPELFPQTSALLKPLGLSKEEQQALIAFLQIL